MSKAQVIHNYLHQLCDKYEWNPILINYKIAQQLTLNKTVYRATLLSKSAHYAIIFFCFSLSFFVFLQIIILNTSQIITFQLYSLIVTRTIPVLACLVNVVAT